MTKRTADEVKSDIKMAKSALLWAPSQSAKDRWRKRVNELEVELAAIERTQDERA